MIARKQAGFAIFNMVEWGKHKVQLGWSQNGRVLGPNTMPRGWTGQPFLM